MTTSLTFRLPKKQRDKLRRKAEALGQSEAEVLRAMLDRELEDRPMSERIGHLVGILGKRKLGHKPDAWEKAIRKNNWRP